MNLLIPTRTVLLFSINIFLFVGCTKYTTNTNASTSSSVNNNQGPTPLPTGGGSGSGSNTGSGSGGSSSTVDSVDAVYMQGFFLKDPTKYLASMNAATYVGKTLELNGYYTSHTKASYKFWEQLVSPQNHSNYVGESNFTKNGYYTVISNTVYPGLIVLNNGNKIAPPTSKSYVRFINITDSASAVSINVKLSNSGNAYYFSYRKPYDFYAGNDIWTSIYNQTYNSNAEYIEVNPGNYNGEIYLTNKVSFFPTYNFVGGKKYTILVRAERLTVTSVNYYYTILQHN